MQHKRFEQPLIYLQDDAGNKIVSLKGLAKFSFQIAVNPQSLKQMIFLLKIIGMILKFNTYY
jgi:hypothetical protein